jgi:hypothetical protein
LSNDDLPSEQITAVRIELEGLPVESHADFDVPHCPARRVELAWNTRSYMYIKDFEVTNGDGTKITPKPPAYGKTDTLPVFLVPTSASKYAPLFMLSDRYDAIKFEAMGVHIDPSEGAPMYYYLTDIYTE